MSNNIMGRVWDFLGLVEDEDAWTPPPPSTASEISNPSSGNVRLISSRPAEPHPVPPILRDSPGLSRDRRGTSTLEVETEVLQIDGFQDCSHLTSWYKAGVPVIMDLRFLSAAVAQGVVYYATGLTSYNQGEVSQVGEGLVLVTPPGARVSPNEKIRLSKIGMWPSATDL